jgi:hypothetical protein
MRGRTCFPLERLEQGRDPLPRCRRAPRGTRAAPRPRCPARAGRTTASGSVAGGRDGATVFGVAASRHLGRWRPQGGHRAPQLLLGRGSVRSQEDLAEQGRDGRLGALGASPCAGRAWCSAARWFPGARCRRQPEAFVVIADHQLHPVQAPLPPRALSDGSPPSRRRTGTACTRRTRLRPARANGPSARGAHRRRLSAGAAVGQGLPHDRVRVAWRPPVPTPGARAFG